MWRRTATCRSSASDRRGPEHGFWVYAGSGHRRPRSRPGGSSGEKVERSVGMLEALSCEEADVSEARKTGGHASRSTMLVETSTSVDDPTHSYLTTTWDLSTWTRGLDLTCGGGGKHRRTRQQAQVASRTSFPASARYQRELAVATSMASVLRTDGASSEDDVAVPGVPARSSCRATLFLRSAEAISVGSAVTDHQLDHTGVRVRSAPNRRAARDRRHALGSAERFYSGRIELNVGFELGDVRLTRPTHGSRCACGSWIGVRPRPKLAPIRCRTGSIP